MTELEKLEYAKTFIDKLARGINPIDNSPIPEGEIANNVRISRCFFYVSDILGQVIENGGVVPVKKTRIKKSEFSLTHEQRDSLVASEKPLTVSEIVGYLNSFIDLEMTKKLSTKTITNWLVEIDALKVIVQADGKNRKIPTTTGYSLGIMTEDRLGQYGPYTVILYTEAAQRFIYDNIDAFCLQDMDEH